MENITKFWVRFRAHPLSSVALVALFSILLMIPWPMGSIVRLLLETHSPETSTKVRWELAYLQPSSGLYFQDLRIDANPRLTVSIPKAFVRFSWIDLMLLQTRIKGIQASQIIVDWNVSPTSSDGDLDYAVPTESHIAMLKPILDSLAPVLDESGVSIHARRIALLMSGDTLSLKEATIEIAADDGEWNINLLSGKIHRGSWPLPDKLNAQLSLLDSVTEVSSLNACWNGGCLDAEGIIGKPGRPSNLAFELHGIPLSPFGTFALPEKAQWKGKAKGEFQWEGRIAHPSSWKAKGNLVMQDVKFIRWPFQREGTFANFVPSLSQEMELDRISIPEFDLHSNRVRVDSLAGSGDDIEVFGKGSWTFPERLDFRLKGSIQDDLYKSLPALTRLALRKEEDGGGFRASLAGSFSWQAIIPDSEHYGTALRNLFN